jgi:hypothetical protein
MKTDKELKESYLKAEFKKLRPDLKFVTFQISDGLGGKTKHLNLEGYKLDKLLALMLED